MNNYTSYIILIILMLPYSAVGAFLGGENTLDLYTNIEENFEQFSQKLTQKELEGGVNSIGIQKNINNHLQSLGLPECIQKEPLIIQIDQIAKGENPPLLDLIGDNCRKDDGSLTTEAYSAIRSEVLKTYNESKEIAEKKITQLQTIESIGLYSDGIKENSGFDLISDIEEIDAIIFASENEYSGEGFEDISEADYFTKDYAGNKLSNNTRNLSRRIHLEDNNNNNKDKVYNFGVPVDSLNNSLVCRGNNSPLEIDIFETLTQTGGLDTTESGSIQNPYEYTRLRGDDTYLVGDFSSQGYSPVSDTGGWGCDGFFCITVDFLSYNHNLLGGGENVTIEYLINRSNKHLQKITSTSLLPATMTVNNFELPFKNLDLAGMLHLGVVISSKPIPILEFPDDGDEDHSIYAAKNMLQEYFKAHDLNYNRRNDLDILQQADIELKSLVSSNGLTIRDAEDKKNEFYAGQQKRRKKIEYITEQIEQKTLNSSLDELNTEFSELNQFTQTIGAYVKNLDALVYQIKKIPVDKN